MTEELELPSYAGGPEGLEGLVVEAGGRRVGRVAAVNRTRDGLVLVVEDAGGFRALPVDDVEEIDLGAGRIRLRDGGAVAWEQSEPVRARQLPSESASLVRFIPPELDRLVTARRASQPVSPLWLLALGCVLVAAVLILPVHLLVENDVGGPLRWLWLALPLPFLVVAAWAAGSAIDAARGERSPLREKLAALQYFLFGISPRRPTGRGRRAGRR
jgi:hypothetical protein